MRFAVISDVHGNLPALNAVIEDAEKECVDYFVFAGDYCLSNPNRPVFRENRFDKAPEKENTPALRWHEAAGGFDPSYVE